MPLQYADECNPPEFFRKPLFNREQSLSEAKTLPFHHLPISLRPFSFHRRIWPPRFYLGCILECEDSLAIARAAGLREDHPKANSGCYCWGYLQHKILEETGLRIEVKTVYNGTQLANIFAFGSNHLFDMIPGMDLLAKAVIEVLGMKREDVGWFVDASWWRWKTTDEIMSESFPELYPDFYEEGHDLRFPLVLSL